MYAIGLYEFFGSILGTLVHRGRVGSVIRDWQFLSVDN